MSVSSESRVPELEDLNVSDIVPNAGNPRLDFPQDELDRLMDSIDQEGILVPIVVYEKDGRYVLVDGERRFRCALTLGLETVPALITAERTELEVLRQMFNIHLIREPWRDIPTAKALQRLVEEIQSDSNQDPTDKQLEHLTGLSIERVRQLRYVVTLPDNWQDFIRKGQIPLNFFWELKKVIDQLSYRRPELFEELGGDAIYHAFVQKRLDGIITDTVSLRKIAPIIRYAAQEAELVSNNLNDIDKRIRDLVIKPEMTIDEVYEDTVQMMVEVDKLGRRTTSMVSAFRRLLAQSTSEPERETIRKLGSDLITELAALLETDAR